MVKYFDVPQFVRGGLKKMIMEFSIKLAGWVLNDLVIHKKKKSLKTLYFA